jgi:hypothetical protein
MKTLGYLFGSMVIVGATPLIYLALAFFSQPGHADPLEIFVTLRRLPLASELNCVWPVSGSVTFVSWSSAS